MKILTRRKQDEIIKRICANEIIFLSQNKDDECIKKYIDNSTEIASLISGYDGVMKYINTMKIYIKDRSSAVSEKEKLS